MTRDERREYMRKYNGEHKEERRKRIKEHKEERKKYKNKSREKIKNRMRERYTKDVNKKGLPKGYIRTNSRKILKSVHSLIQGYEIHHCFGYEDPNKFIYIPKSLHIQIHQLLRDKKIQSDSDHWNLIRELVNECEEYTYIRT